MHSIESTRVRSMACAGVPEASARRPGRLLVTEDWALEKSLPQVVTFPSLARCMFSGQFGRVRGQVVTLAAGQEWRHGTAHDDPSLYLCQIGSGVLEVEQDGRGVRLEPGDLVCFDGMRPYTVRAAHSAELVLISMPHRDVAVTPELSAALTARSWTSERATAAVVSALLSVLGAQVRAGVIGDDLVGDGLVCFVKSFFAERLRREVPRPADSVRYELLLRIHSYARQQLSDPGLAPEDLAKAHNVSLRYLQKLFREHGDGEGPSGWIRQERLSRCRTDLEDPRLDNQSVASIGERHGFSNASHFSRLFRSRFGLPPQQYRKQAREQCLEAALKDRLTSSSRSLRQRRSGARTVSHDDERAQL